MASDADLALLLAAENGDLKSLREALQDGARPTATTARDPIEGITPLMLAAKHGRVEIARLLLQCGATLEQKTRCLVPGESARETALHWAVASRHHPICRVLIDAGADVNAASTRGSVLSYAAESGDLRLVRMLLDAGSSPNTHAGRENKCAIHVAAETGEARIIRLLYSRGAKLMPMPHSQRTPLMLACQHAHPEAVSALFECGDPLEARDRKGWTPMMYAAWGGEERTVKLLIRYGADLAATTAEGKSASNLAQEADQPAALFWIEKAAQARRSRRKAHA